MNEIIALTDYKGFFGSKYNAVPYNSGMDKDLLKKEFAELGFELKFFSFSEIDNKAPSFWIGKNVIYTSAEDIGFNYKDYIEDLIFFLELSGANVIPKYKYLRATNNKVFMELMGKTFQGEEEKSLWSKAFGTLDDMKIGLNSIKFPVVFKTASGAMSSGVGLAQNATELTKQIKKISRTKNIFKELWELGRSLKHKGYKKESKYRKKYILQEFIPSLSEDYKILVFGNKYYVLKRHVRKNDFRASGSGNLEYVKDVSHDLLDYAKCIFERLKVPNASFDIAFDGENYYLFEYQSVYFGCYTLIFSKWYFKREKNMFHLVESESSLEKVYAESVSEFLAL